jgi:hypothetical protein
VTGVQCFRSAFGLCCTGKYRFLDVAENVAVCILRVTIWQLLGMGDGGPFIDLAGNVTIPHIARCQVYVRSVQHLPRFFHPECGN